MDELLEGVGNGSSTPTKEAIQAYMADLATRMLSTDDGDAKSMTFTKDDYKTYVNSLPDNLRGFASDAFGDAIVAGAKEVIPEANNDQLDQLKTFAKTSIVKTGIGAAAGIAQIVDGAFKNSKLKRPKLPEGFKVNDQIKTRITQSIARENDGNAILKRISDARIAEGNFVGNQIAKATSGGDPSRFNANAQANNIRATNSQRDLLGLFEDNKRRNRAETDGLLRELRTQESLETNDEFRRFGTQERRFDSDRRSNSDQINSGLGNLFDNVGGAIDALAGLKAVNSKLSTNTQAIESSIPNSTTRTYTTPSSLDMGLEIGARSEDPLLQSIIDTANGVDRSDNGITNTLRDIMGVGPDDEFDIGLNLLDRSIGSNVNDLSSKLNFF